jgi:hypothetical protein
VSWLKHLPLPERHADGPRQPRQGHIRWPPQLWQRHTVAAHRRWQRHARHMLSRLLGIVYEITPFGLSVSALGRRCATGYIRLRLLPRRLRDGAHGDRAAGRLRS